MGQPFPSAALHDLPADPTLEVKLRCHALILRTFFRLQLGQEHSEDYMTVERNRYAKCTPHQPNNIQILIQKNTTSVYPAHANWSYYSP